jgi:hypothetical protein
MAHTGECSGAAEAAQRGERMSDYKEGFSMLLALGEALGITRSDVCDPNIPEEDRFIPPANVNFLTARNAAAARAACLILPWEQLYEGEA